MTRPKTFSEWLLNHADKDTPVGEMARGWKEDRHTTPNAQRAAARREVAGEECADYILGAWWDSAGPAYIGTLAQALASYSAYLRRWAVRYGA